MAQFAPAVRLFVLGPVRADVGGVVADLGGPRQRAVLARLAVAGGEVVSADRLVDDLWGGADVPARGLASLQVHISHLRRALEPARARRTPASVLVSAPPGYALRLPAEAVDAWHFGDLVRRASTAGPADRHALLSEALARWQGDAYAEVADEPWAAPEAARLAELRLLAVESRAEADLELGRPALVIAELERHLRDHPAREGAVRLLALALYRTGRQGDALATLRRTRDHLAEELGVDPSRELRTLEADILTHAATLAGPSPQPRPAAPPTHPTSAGSAAASAEPDAAEHTPAGDANPSHPSTRPTEDSATPAALGLGTHASASSSGTSPSSAPSHGTSPSSAPSHGTSVPAARNSVAPVAAAPVSGDPASAAPGQAPLVPAGPSPVAPVAAAPDSGGPASVALGPAPSDASGPNLVAPVAAVLDSAAVRWGSAGGSGGAGVRTAAWGRKAELAAIAGAAGEVASGVARVVLVGGDAGAGKTTLAEVAVAGLVEAGWRARTGRCPEVDGAPPGWAWSEALGVDLLQGDEPNAFRLGRRIAADLAGARTVVLLEDVHRADDLTLQLVRQVVAQGTPLLVLLTYRSSDLGDELEATIGALLSVTSAHLTLSGLEPAAVAELARRYGLEEAGPELLALVAERTEGNPLFVRELARLIAAEGATAAETAVPKGVREVLRRRVARLPDAVTSALRQAAVLGREADLDVLADVAGRDPDELLDALEVAVLAGLLEEPVPGRVRFTHALVRDTLYEDTPLLRRARLHERALRVLDGTVEAATLSRHAAAAANPATASDAVRYAIDAARHAERAGSWREAAAQWREALRLHELAGSRATGEKSALLAAAVTAHARAGDIIRARTIYLRSDNLDVLTAWDAPLIWTTRDGREPSAATIAAIRRELARPHPSEIRVRLLLALFRELEGYDDAAAAEVSAEALTLARETARPARLLCAALNARAYAALGPDLREERRAVAEEYLATAVAAGEIDHEAVAHWLLFLDSAAHTELDRARAEMRRAVARSTTGQLSGLLAVVGIFEALLELLAGRIDQALERYAEVSRRLAEHGALNGAAMATVGRIGAGVARGDLAPLRDELTAIEAVYPGRVTDALVLALVDAGDLAAAREVWQRRGEIDRNYYWLGFTTLRGLAAARLGDEETGRRIAAELLPFAGRVAGLDSGTLYAGPVDAALYALTGDPAYRRSALELTERLRS
ncbi:BTAD domain-containing putative transcriptional regulator [Actinoplanes sp. NPDC049596]|uniref:BTAD domain-containing putative transcriptional regulator n=1 Tax=unclassified Actinoplanes TaxID=2626549 RepID=UPI00341EA8E7